MRIHYRKKLIPLYEFLHTYLLSGHMELPHGKRAIFFLSPDYGNIGDIAIEDAQTEFMKKLLPDYTFIHITVKDSYKYLKSLRRQLNDTDLVFLVGGGNFGDLYPKIDFARLKIINFFYYRQICSLPQSIFYTKTKYGDKRLEKTIKALDRCRDITLFAREKRTYEFMNRHFLVSTHLSPDIVLSFIHSRPSNTRGVRREGAILTLRNDSEKGDLRKYETEINEILEKNFASVKNIDTGIAPADFKLSMKHAYFENILSAYCASEIVLTDRLHGMIFATITGTPCIALPNSNNKISDTYYDWLSRSNFVTFVDTYSSEELERILKLYRSKDFKNNRDELVMSFNELETYVKTATHSSTTQ